MSTFNQIMAMQKLTETLARLDMPLDGSKTKDEMIAALAKMDIETIHQATMALQEFVEEARLILKQTKRQRKSEAS